LRPDQVGWLCGIDLPEGDYDTIGGLVMDRLGRIPTVGDHVQGTGWQMRVRSMDGRRIGDVELVTEPNGEK
jgi:CBS domain containing-hemolysin-like protein